MAVVLHRGQLGSIRRHQDLADPFVRDAELAAERIERMLPGHTKLRFQAPRGVVDPGVDHFAVARGSFRADHVGRFQDHHLVAPERHLARHRQADHTGADHRTIHFERHFSDRFCTQHAATLAAVARSVKQL